MTTVYPNNGIIRLYDGTLVYIEEVQYSPDGINNWESTFNPMDHISVLDNVTLIEGHKYRRVRHAGDTEFQIPSKWIPEDGQSAMIQVTETEIQWKLELDTIWNTLVLLEDLKGEQGEQGVEGAGLTVNYAGVLDTRPSCDQALPGTCNTCNTSASALPSPTLFMSIGNHKIETADVVDELTYWHTLDGTTWTQTTNTHIGLVVLGWQATDGTGTASLTTNLLGQVMLFTATGLTWAEAESKGKIYVCAESTWTPLTSVSSPTGYVKANASDTLGYLEAKIDDITIGLTNNKLHLKDGSVTKAKLATGIFTDGLDESDLTTVKAKVEDFAGFGLSSYTSDTNSEEDLQVIVDPLLSDGLVVDNVGVPTDGETYHRAKVDVNALINNNSGLISTTEADTFDDLQVNLGDGLEFSTDLVKAIKVDADELSLEVTTDHVHVKTYTSGNDGILASHLNPNVANTNKGLEVNNTSGTFVKVDNLTIGYDGTGNLEVPDNGITGDKLNNNVANNAKGIVVINDVLEIKPDNTSIEFSGTGELQVIDSYITNLIDGTFVSSLNTLQGDIAIAGVASTYIDLDITSVGQNVNITPSLDTGLLITNIINPAISAYDFSEIIDDRVNTLLIAGTGIALAYDDVANTLEISSTATPPTSGSVSTLDGNKVDGILDTYARADHKHDFADDALTIAKTVGLQAALDSKMELDTKYGNMTVTNLNGIILTSPSGNNYILQVDDLGGLDTQRI